MNKTTFAANGRVNVSNVSPSDQIDSGRKKKKELEKKPSNNLSARLLEYAK